MMMEPMVEEHIPGEMVFSFWDLLAVNVAAHPDHTALRERGESVSYGDLAARAEQMAAWLEARGVERGDRVGVHLPKSVQ